MAGKVSGLEGASTWKAWDAPLSSAARSYAHASRVNAGRGATRHLACAFALIGRAASHGAMTSPLSRNYFDKARLNGMIILQMAE